MPKQEPRALSWDAFVELLTAGDLSAALDACTLGIVHDADNGRWLIGQAWALMGLGRLEDALSSVRQAAERDADEVFLAQTLATLYLELGNLDDALDAAEHAYRLDDEDEASHKLLLTIREARRAAAQDVPQEQSARAANPAPVPRPRPSAPGSARSSDRRAFARFMAAGTTAKSGRGGGEQVVSAGRPALRDFTPHVAWTVRAEEVSRRTIAGPHLASMPDAQLEALHGMSLFGRWQALVAPAPVPGWTRYLVQRPGWWRGWLLAVIASLPLLAGVIVAGEALQRRHQQLREHSREYLKQLLHIGAIEQIPQPLRAASRLVKATAVDDSPLAHLMTRAQATVYRLHDASPERLAAVRAARAGPSWNGSYDEVVTRALMAPVAERLTLVPALSAVAAQQPEDGQAALLIATAALRADDLVAAAAAIDRALAVEPANLVNLALAAVVDARRQRFAQAANRLAEMRDASPWAAAVEVAARRLQVLYGLPPRFAPALDRTRRAAGGPVLKSVSALLDAVGAERQGDAARATAAIRTALAAVGGAPAFAVDYADTLLEARAPRLAALVVAVSTWPADSPGARSVTARLALAQGRRREARRSLAALWREGSRDPRVATALAELLAARPSRGLDVVAVLTRTLEAWPDRLDLEAQLAELLWSRKKAALVVERLSSRISRFDAAADATLAARAYLCLARAEAQLDDRAKALQLASHALQLSPEDADAQALVHDLEQPSTSHNGAGSTRRKHKRGRR